MRQSFSVAQILTAAQMTQLQDSVWSDDVNTQTGTSYTVVLTDAGKQVTMSNASASTLTVPPNSSVAFDVGTRIQVIQLGAGAVTLTQGAGVTVSSLAASLVMKQYQVAILIKTGTNTWVANLGASGGAVTSSATAPVSPSAGDLWFNTSTGATFIYYNSAWVELGGGTMSPYQATSTTRPSSPWTGQHVYETDTKNELTWDGSAWSQQWNMPRGLISVTNVTSTSSAVSVETLRITSPSFTAVANRYYRISYYEPAIQYVSGTVSAIDVKIRLTSTAGTQYQLSNPRIGSVGNNPAFVSIVTTLTAGATVFVGTFAPTGGGTGQCYASATAVAQLIIEDIGPA